VQKDEWPFPFASSFPAVAIRCDTLRYVAFPTMGGEEYHAVADACLDMPRMGQSIIITNPPMISIVAGCSASWMVTCDPNTDLNAVYSNRRLR
jgi:hypothetical protein